MTTANINADDRVRVVIMPEGNAIDMELFSTFSEMGITTESEGIIVSIDKSDPAFHTATVKFNQGTVEIGLYRLERI